ncbi:hypothetical protein KSE_25360 [Kitasatospora setae KM-6054]|uniref:Uncharacterized protein n=1 Tax=Kitasatospora setae (strain ATCC 33774 / DSM 43861 / JCM 3304 / KCC A-0304 / NBRC 14216 / KM-6054) TaxID=452652 RepID=E4NAW8_KITSK|nr:hypothetical protein KSE_25360 [Kitasatospora setae KM-6054]
MSVLVALPSRPDAGGGAGNGAGGVVRVGRRAVVRRAGWLRPEVLFLGCGLVLLPWAALLALLPDGTPWAVLDLVESAALSTAALRLRRGRTPSWSAGLAGVLLATDAGCDLATASGGSELLVALLMAVCAELPLAAVCWSTALRAGAVGPGGGPVPAAGRGCRSRGRVAVPVPVGGPPTGFLTEGVAVRSIHMLTGSVPGLLSGTPAGRVCAGQADRLRVATAGCRPDRPARSDRRAPAAGLRVRAEGWAPRPCPDRAHRAVLPASAARMAATARRDPGVHRRPAAERAPGLRELRARRLHRGAAGPRRRSAVGG